MRQCEQQAKLHAQSWPPQPNGDLVGMSERASGRSPAPRAPAPRVIALMGWLRSTGWRLTFEGE
jgi:hypothetical protein